MSFPAECCIRILPSIVNFYGCATRTFAFGTIGGSGNARLNLAVAIFDGIIGRIGIAYLLGIVFALEPIGFWMGNALAGYMPFVISGVYYLSGKWKK